MSDIVVTIPGKPVGKGRPRFNRAQGRAYTPKATESAEAWAKACMMKHADQVMLDGPLEIEILATMPVPASWSKKKQADAIAGILRPTGKPDFDNCAKLLCDSGNGILWRDDSQIVAASFTKIYGDKPGVVLTVRAA